MFKKKLLISLILVGLMATSISAFAQSSGSVPATECIKSAVAARETALGLALADYTRSIGIAYSDRAVALQSAYSQTSDKAIKSAVKSAWSSFNTFIKSVKNKWSMAKSSAWSTYRTAAKNCKVTSGISDSSNSGYELSGN